MSLAFVSSSLIGLVLVTSVLACDKSEPKLVITPPAVELPRPPQPEVVAAPEAKPPKPVAASDALTVTPAPAPDVAAVPDVAAAPDVTAAPGGPVGFEAYASVEGKFKVQAPADAKAHQGSVEWSWLRGPGALGVTWEDLARAPAGKATDKALAAARDAFLELFGAELVKEEPVEVANATGAREVTYTTPDPDAPTDTAKRLPGVARFVVAGARVYTVSGRRMEPGAMDGFQHFVRSFAVGE